MYGSFVCVYVSAPLVCLGLEEALRKHLIPWDLKIQKVMSHHVGPGNQVLSKSIHSALSTTEPFFFPFMIFLIYSEYFWIFHTCVQCNLAIPTSTPSTATEHVCFPSSRFFLLLSSLPLLLPLFVWFFLLFFVLFETLPCYVDQGKFVHLVIFLPLC